jgi:hypothetical protein
MRDRLPLWGAAIPPRLKPIAPQIIRSSIDRLKLLDGRVLAGHDGISPRLHPSGGRCGTDLHPEHRDKYARHRDRDSKIEDSITHEIPPITSGQVPVTQEEGYPKTD